jgi:hypothetical protein
MPNQKETTMTLYKVISDNFTYGKRGSTVSESVLEGLDLQMLVEAGHLEPITAKTSNKQTTQAEGEQ